MLPPSLPPGARANRAWWANYHAHNHAYHGWLAVGCIFAAIWLCIWRGLRALPSDGLNEARQ